MPRGNGRNLLSDASPPDTLTTILFGAEETSAKENQGVERAWRAFRLERRTPREPTTCHPQHLQARGGGPQESRMRMWLLASRFLGGF
jgi:hypothetical protein